MREVIHTSTPVPKFSTATLPIRPWISRTLWERILTVALALSLHPGL